MLLCHVLFFLIPAVSHVRSSSLTFVIDDSGSMHDDIAQVKRGANRIMDSILDRKASQIDDIVVVTFSDPVDQIFVKKSKEREEVRAHLNSIYAHNHPGNKDWPEYSLSGTQRALEESSQDSYLFVFTDASASDDYKAADVIDLCQRKQSQVVFILTGYCPPWYNEQQCLVYYEVAKACSGHVFRIERDKVEEVVTSVIINIKDQGTELKTVDIPPNIPTYVPFTIDKKTEQAIVYTTGTNVSLDVNAPGSTKEVDLWTPHVKVVKLKGLTPGTYGATVEGTSKTSVTIIAKTSFLFEHGFSELKPQHLGDTTKQPVEGRKSHLSVLVQDNDHSVTIKSVELANMDGKVIGEEIPLTKIAGDLYMTDLFVPPSTMFKITVKGTIIANGEPIRRTAKTAVQPIKQTKESVKTAKYGEKVTMLCEIKSSMPLEIKWLLNDTELEISDKYSVSANGAELNIKFMELDLVGRYTCKVSLVSYPRETVSYNTDVQITGLVAPKMLSNFPDVITTQSEKSITLTCQILQGNPKPSIRWVFKSKNSDKFVRLENSEESLHIASAALTDSGNYMCIVENVVGTVQKSTEIIVEAAPKIIPNNNDNAYNAVTGDIVLRIPCNVTGYPKPVVTWKKEDKPVISDEKYSIEDNVLVIKRPVEIDTNKYTCEAKNALGEAKQTYEVTVTSTVDYSGNNSVVFVLRNETKKLNCLLPHTDSDSITWYLNGHLMNNTGAYLQLNHASVFNDGNYTCRVSNNLGSNSETYVLDVGYPPKFIVSEETTDVQWRGEGKMDCNVDAKPIPGVQWFYNGNPIKGATLQLNVIGWGEYSCRVSNVHGSVEKMFKVSSNDCLIKTDAESGHNAALLLSETSTWPRFEINNNFLMVPSKNKFKLSCHSEGKTNVFQKFQTMSEIEVACDHQDLFQVDKKLYKYSDFRCKEDVMATVVQTGKKCLHEDTELLRVGFNVKDFVEAYELCFDKKHSRTLYARAKMSSTRQSGKISDEKWYEYDKLGGSNSASGYTCENQYSSCCYAKHQLVNAKDVSYGPAQKSTFIDNLNAVPYWRSCKGSHRKSWESIEELIRYQVEAYPDFYVWSGASNFTNIAGRNTPRYLWKVIKLIGEDETAVVYVNDPNPEDSDLRCTNTCGEEAHFWISSSDKFTYCCNLDDFFTAFEIPESIIVYGG